MGASESATATMRAVRFHNYGDPADMLRLDEVAKADRGRLSRISESKHGLAT